MLIIADDSESTSKFVDQNYADSDANNDVYGFIQVFVIGGKTPLAPADAAFLKERIGRCRNRAVSSHALSTPTAMSWAARRLTSPKVAHAEEVANFIHQHGPRSNVEEKWAAAFAEASRTNRRDWARVSQRYCGPWFMLTRWLDDQRTL